jgi:succinate dehydrogenase / fumarate reductase, cytochrome b subunit
MADAKAGTAGSRTLRPGAPRPLSPHLSIFRPYINMVMSIVHRITGAANYFGSLLLAIWLISAAAGEAQFNAVSSALGSIPGLVMLFGFTWSVMHHMLGGIRHFIWDSGRGFDKPTVRALSWATPIGSVALTGLIWVAALSVWSAR